MNIFKKLYYSILGIEKIKNFPENIGFKRLYANKIPIDSGEPNEKWWKLEKHYLLFTPSSSIYYLYKDNNVNNGYSVRSVRDSSGQEIIDYLEPFLTKRKREKSLDELL